MQLSSVSQAVNCAASRSRPTVSGIAGIESQSIKEGGAGCRGGVAGAGVGRFQPRNRPSQPWEVDWAGKAAEETSSPLRTC